jgi:hypothetical protein
MNEGQKEVQFIEKVKGLLDESAENLDPRIRHRLQQARIQALEARGKRRFSFFTFPRWITIGGLATVATAVLAFFFLFNAPRADFPTKQAEDFEILTSKEHIDFYSDLEFFRWLATKENET